MIPQVFVRQCSSVTSFEAEIHRDVDIVDVGVVVSEGVVYVLVTKEVLKHYASIFTDTTHFTLSAETDSYVKYQAVSQDPIEVANKIRLAIVTFDPLPVVPTLIDAGHFIICYRCWDTYWSEDGHCCEY